MSDNAQYFNSEFFQSVCKILNVENQFTTTYHPQTNGQVERYNRTLKSAIKSYLDDHPLDWDLYTPALTYAYNCQPHSSTSLAPFELVLSRPPPPLSLQEQPAASLWPRIPVMRGEHSLRKLFAKPEASWSKRKNGTSATMTVG